MEYNYTMLNQLMKTHAPEVYEKMRKFKAENKMPKDKQFWEDATLSEMKRLAYVQCKNLSALSKVIYAIKRKLDLNEADYEDLRQKYNKLHNAYRTNGQCEDLKRLVNKTCAAHKKISKQKTAADEKNAELEQTVSDLQNKFTNTEKQTECLEEQLKAAVALNKDVQKNYLESEL